MTEEQFEALKRWMDCTATAVAMHLDGGGGMALSRVEQQVRDAERDAHDAFCGKTWEQPRG
jgi:hypothetical protein